jgi:hypothetical protein
MYAAHFAAALAVKGQAPKAPSWALLVGAFLPDFAWVALGLAGVEPSQGPVFFDDWSHSLAMIVVWATLFAVCFWRLGMAVMLPVWLSVLSHFVLDLPIHPKNLALFPHSSAHLGWNSWNYGLSRSWLGATHYWWIELAALAVLIVLYVRGARRAQFAMNLILASCTLVIGLHLMALL